MNQTSPTLAEAREAARQLGGTSASVVIRFLEALAAATPGPTERADPPAQLEQQQPPLGLRPLEFAVHDRHVELLEAIQRYRQADYTVPIAWEQELAAVRWLRDLLRFTSANGRPL